MGYDTDGTHWMTVRYTVDVRVMADSTDEAIYYADLALPDCITEGLKGTRSGFDAQVVED